ncbi:MAG: hypothetical protein WCV68_01830 [Candidatus Paceibacterota bacterium]|jgi:hypothetical protein
MKKHFLFPPILLLALFGGAVGIWGSSILPQAGEESSPGFLVGVWHGVISPITFVISLFMSHVDFVDTCGGPKYIIGFLFGGAVLLFGGRALSQKLY